MLWYSYSNRLRGSRPDLPSEKMAAHCHNRIRKKVIMLSDLLTFLETLPEQSLQTGEQFLPDSFDIYVQRFQALMGRFDDTYKMIGAIVSLVFALLICFFGYKFSRIFMSITGFIAGALLGYGAATQIFNLTGIPLIAVVVVAGIIIAAMASWIYLAGIFILCFFLAFMASASLLPFSGDIQFFLCCLIGLIIAALAMRYMRPVIIVITSLVGGICAASLLTKVGPYLNFAVFHSLPSKMVLAASFFILGLLVQFLTTRNPNSPVKRRPKHSRR